MSKFSIRLRWLALAVPLCAVGCRGEEVSHARVPKEAAPEPPSQMRMPNQGKPDVDVPPPPAVDRQGGLKWTLPKGWTESAGGDAMRYATLKGPQGTPDITVVVLGGTAGGELPNVNRWRGQLGMAPTDEAGLPATRSVVNTKVGAIQVYDLAGDKNRMLAAMLIADGRTWFIKMMGESSALGAAKPTFLQLVESLRLDTPSP